MENEIIKQLIKFGNARNLMKYFTTSSMNKVHNRMSNNKAPGVDGITKDKYAICLFDNISQLITRMKELKYYPNPVKRVEIPKDNGSKRSLGIPCYEDKLVETKMSEIFNIIYEPIFEDSSFGFRPGRSCHNALDEIARIVKNEEINYILDADIKGFFDNLNQETLINLLKKKIKDKILIEYVRRFLKAGIMTENKVIKSEEGVPQGGIISPILANVYLHYALDNWFKEYVLKKKIRGKCYLIRYADDFIILIQHKKDTNQIYNMVRKRLNKYNLQLNEEKTKVFRFNLKEASNNSFNFLGLNISNYKDKDNKVKLLYRITDKNAQKKKEKVDDCIEECDDIYKLINNINEKLRGYYNYYGYNTNMEWMKDIYNYAITIVLNWCELNLHMCRIYSEMLCDVYIVKPQIRHYI